ncbi:hypothetical protein H4R18_004492 [Coemansia javaensis]|uniref:DNA polymerase delta subunit 3 n=1 Tax=Coemansia javaensis TaxID=2761396 RepID=A0A9W8HC25_9FUNG|nr:hypothetical protein H4R18_004492 [Coemansia javaensis]
MDSPDQVLGQLVVHEAQTVTYRRLSRELGVHVNVAKLRLADYHQAHRDECSATFLVTGTGRGGELSMRLVAESELAAAQAEVDGARHHVYSVGPRIGVSRQDLVTANEQAGANRDMAELGAVRSSVTLVVDAHEPAPSHEPAAASAPGNGSAPSSGAKPDVKRTDSPAASAGKTKSAKLSFGRGQVATKPATKPKPAPTSKSEADAKEEPTSKPEAETEIKEEPKTESQAMDATEDTDEGTAVAAQGPRVEDMFMDDSDFEDGPAKREEAKAPPEDRSRGAVPETSDVEMAGVDSEAGGADPEADGAEPGAGGRRRIRKRRKVTKIRHTKNDRGMLVSQAVDCWESYSESEPEPTPDTRAHATPAKRGAASSEQDAGAPEPKKPAGKKGRGAAPQRSIMSFFGKK